MDEPEFGVPAAEIARISRLALKTLAEEHVIIPKDEFNVILDSHMTQSQEQVWSLLLSSYQNAIANLPADAPKDYKKGFALGLNLIERIHSVYRQEYDALFDKNHENSQEDI